ncbi:MAG: hypothetical protein V4478_01530 [Patescibacteria group bacterium]
MEPYSAYTITPISAVLIKCALCDREMTLAEYEQHLKLHVRAEMLADILALSRR